MAKGQATRRQKDISRMLREQRLRSGFKKKVTFSRSKTVTFFMFFVFVLCGGVSSFAQETQVFFSPQRGCTKAIVTQLSKARQSLDIAMYSLTSDDIVKEIMRAKSNKVKVRILCDKSQRGQRSSQIGFLRDQGIMVRVYDGQGLMHNKFALIDDKVLITGSFNWTKNAEESNAENLLIIFDKKLIARYAKEFVYLWVQGEEERTQKSFKRTTQEMFRYLEKILRQIIKALFHHVKSPHGL